MLVAYDREGNIFNIVKRKSGLALEPKVFQAIQTVGLQLREETDIPVGEVYLRAGIFDLSSGSCGTLGIALRTVVPKIGGSAFQPDKWDYK
jgi:hypothetical protein